MDLAQELFRELSHWPQIEAIALGGSRATGRNDAASDYDVYLYCTAPVPLEQRRTTLAKYCDAMEIGNHYWEAEDNCTFKDGIDLDLLHRNLDGFTADLARVVEDAQPSNGYTTCIWHNLRTCTVLYDRDGRLAAAKERFDVPYPEPLRQAIIERNMKLMHGVLPSYDAQIHKAASRGDLVSVNHRVAAFLESYFDVLFALNRMTHPGEKRQMAIALEQCELLPDDFKTNLDRLFADMFTGPDRLDADIAAIVQEMERAVQMDQSGPIPATNNG